jgi:NAD(P)-dependent dehydrogenase (short-subunit alcohol dehydrogenase family)
MKIAITGNSSGIGLELDTVLSLITKHEINGFSKSNGHNIASNDGDDIINTLLEYDPDVLFNNAYYPKIQNKILETLYNEWRDRDKVIINTGSISGYLKGILLNDDSDYVNDKKALSDFCIRNSFNYPWANKCRIHCISFGFVATPLITNTSKDVNKADLIGSESAAFALIDLMEQKDYNIAEQVINCVFSSDEDMFLNFDIASRNMLKHVARSRKAK